MSPKISQLVIYPVKSLPGVSVERAHVNKRGIGLDRRWMIVDAAGRMMTQRTHAKLSQIKTHMNEEGLALRFKDCRLKVSEPTNETVLVTVWQDSLRARMARHPINEFLSDSLGQAVRLVWMDDHVLRAVEQRPGTAGKYVGFADGYPFLIVSAASLNDLNTRLPEPITMERFRPNIVVTNTLAFEEDSWKRFRVGGTTFTHVKPCARCVLTTVDPVSGNVGVEPLRTLATYRRVKNEVLFGQNAVHEGDGSLEVGAEVKVLEHMEPPFDKGVQNP